MVTRFFYVPQVGRRTEEFNSIRSGKTRPSIRAFVNGKISIQKDFFSCTTG